MYVIVDGSYCQSKPETVSAAVVITSDSGFYTDQVFQTKHVEASSTLAEWFAIEKLIDEIQPLVSESIVSKVECFTDYADVVRILSSGKYSKPDDLPFKNKYLRSYIFDIQSKLKRLKAKHYLIHAKELSIRFNHIQIQDRADYIFRLHQKAHNLAKSSLSVGHKKNVRAVQAEKVKIKIRLKEVELGSRKWVLSENDMPLYSGKLRKVINLYQKERSNLTHLMSEGKLSIDKKTQQVLLRHIPSIKEYGYG